MRRCALIRFAKRGRMRFLGHLDLARAMDRAVRRSGLPAAYSEGFNPRAKIAFAAPLPVGVESEAELCLIELEKPIATEKVAAALGPQLPEGLSLVGVEMGLRGKRSPLADITVAQYVADLALTDVRPGEVLAAAEGLMATHRVLVTRKTKSGESTEDIRPAIQELRFVAQEPPRLEMTLKIGGRATAKPEEIITALRREIGRENAVAVTRLIRTSLR